MIFFVLVYCDCNLRGT